MHRLLSIAITMLLCACGGGDSGSNPGPAPTAPSNLSYPAIPSLIIGTAITAVTPTVTGTVTSYSVAPSLPAGLSLNATTGAISGTPTVVAPATAYVVSAANSVGSTSFTLSITVNAAAEFRLEPANGTTIGIGQQIDIFAAFKARSTDPYPQYLDAALVTYGSSQASVAVANSSGQVRGVSAGTATITAAYQNYTAQIVVTVAGNYVERSLSVAGQGTRNYSIYVPAGTAGQRPMLLAIHGGGGTARINASTTLLSKLGADRGAFIVYTEGTGIIQTYNAGNCCGSAQTQNVDDVAFIAAVIDDVRANYPIDAARVYSTGFSNGGMLSHRLACALADRIAGIAAVGGASGQFDLAGTRYYNCAPTRPIRILQLHATNDRNYPFNGGVGEGLSNTNFNSVDATIANWLTHNNVTNQAAIENVSATTTCYRYATAVNPNLPSAPVTLCKTDPPDLYDATTGIVHGGGHSWPGGNRSPSAGGDAPRTDFDANAYLWGYLTAP
jgi:polyhydroxybutyrate depolymerase